MKKILFFVLLLILLQSVVVSALNSGDARDDWIDAKEATLDAKIKHEDAKANHAKDKTPENQEKVVDTGKVLLSSALDEAEAWLIWKDTEAKENQNVPDDIKDAIKRDVEKNLQKIETLRAEVDSVKNGLELGVVFIKMVGSYVELLVDVAKNTGNMWVHVLNVYLDNLEKAGDKVMAAAEKANNEKAIGEMNSFFDDLKDARDNVDKADDSYSFVVTPGTPFIKFTEGNNYLNMAKLKAISAHQHLNDAFRLVTRGE